MATPLMGSGSPGPNTTDVYLSVYLDRLLNVDDIAYRWTGVLYFYLSWTDPAAYQTVRAATDGWLAGNRSCAHECSDWVREEACCDGIYTPTFFFRNAHSFPQDRATGYKTYALPEPNNSVLWTQTVQATYYQPMDLSHYPFDSFELVAILEFLDTALPPHPGVKVHISSGGPRLYTFGKGDAVSEWEVQSLSVNLVYVDSEAFFKSHWTLPSDPNDPLGLTTTPSARLRGCPPGATSVQAANNVTMAQIRIRIKRFWRYTILNSVIPVALLGVLSFVVFFLDCKELATRLGVVVTLFLAMAAVQFVITEHQPASSYIMPTQQLVIATYVLLALIASESIVVYYIVTWKRCSHLRNQRKAARDRYLAQRAALKAAAAADASSGKDSLPSYKPPPSAGSSAQQSPHQKAAAEAVAEVAKEAAAAMAAEAVTQAAVAAAAAQGSRSGGGCTAPSRRTLTRLQSLCEDEQLDEYYGQLIDRASLAVLATGYFLTCILIFTLQSGYIDLFGSG